MVSKKAFGKHFGGIARALSSRNYRVYWYGHLVSSNGVWIYIISSQWLIFHLTESPAWLGAIGFGYLAPLFFIGPLAGAISDRFGQKETAMVALIVGIFLATAIAVVIFLGSLTPMFMLIFTIVQGIFFAFDFPSRQALIPQMVKKSDISAAIGMNTTTYNTSSFTGPLIGGAILAFGNSTIGPTVGAALGYVAFAFANCFMLFGVCRVNVKPRSSNKNYRGNLVPDVLRDLKSGIRYVSKNPYLLLLMGLSLFFAFFLRSYQNLMAGIAGELFNLDEQGLGTLFAAKGIGALFVALILARRGRTQGLTKVCAFGAGIGGCVLIVFVTSSYLPLTLALSAGLGGMVVATDLAIMTLIQNVVADEYRARVIGIALAISVGIPAIGSLAIGFLAEYTNLEFSMCLSAIIVVFASMFIGSKIIKNASEIERLTSEVKEI